jgi:hypothetical protein
MREQRWVVPILGLVVLAGLTAAFVFDRPLYVAILTAVMMRPFATPFIDIAQMPGVIDCWQHGVDPYVTASCDLLDRPFAYSPLWLRAGFLPTSLDAVPWIGLVLDSAVFLSLALLPVPRRHGGLAILVLVVFSSLPAFALERVNVDVVMFLLIVAGGWIWLRSDAFRLFGYAMFVLAGLLKFYPLVLCLLVVRERFIRAALLSLAVFAALALFVLYFRAELAEMAANLPVYSYFQDSFGARQLPAGIGVMLQELGVKRLPFIGPFDPEHSIALALDVLFFSHIAALGFAVLLATRPALGPALLALTAAESGFLTIGAALFCGCFFAGQNVGYRGIHFLFIVPGLAALALASAPSAMRSLFRVTLGLTLLLTWGLTLQQLIAWLSGGLDAPMGGSIAIDLYWIGHELAWWWVITVLLGVLFRLIADMPAWHSLPRLRRPA